MAWMYAFERERPLPGFCLRRRVAFEKLAARLEFDCGEQRSDAEQHPFALIRLTAVPASHVNRAQAAEGATAREGVRSFDGSVDATVPDHSPAAAHSRAPFDRIVSSPC
jgi:hypothetical protein